MEMQHTLEAKPHMPHRLDYNYENSELLVPKQGIAWRANVCERKKRVREKQYM